MTGEIITMMSGKGGVGKTSIAVNMAHFFASYGVRTLLVDCDINTGGATTFYRLGGRIPVGIGSANTFHGLLEALEDEKDIGIEADHKTEYCIRIEEELDFIPAFSKYSNIEYGQFSAEKVSAIKEALGRQMECWKNTYQIIILDQCAGYTPLIELMMSYSQIAILVQEANTLSTESTRQLYNQICGKYVGLDIVCCMNKGASRIGRRNTENEPQTGQLVPQYKGFSQSGKFAEMVEKGAVISLGENDMTAELVELLQNIFPENIALDMYRLQMEELETQRIQEEREERQREIKEYNRRRPGIIISHALVLILSVLAIPVVEYFLKKPQIWIYCLIFVAAFVVFYLLNLGVLKIVGYFPYIEEAYDNKFRRLDEDEE